MVGGGDGNFRSCEEANSPMGGGFLGSGGGGDDSDALVDFEKEDVWFKLLELLV